MHRPRPRRRAHGREHHAEVSFEDLGHFARAHVDVRAAVAEPRAVLAKVTRRATGEPKHHDKRAISSRGCRRWRRWRCGLERARRRRPGLECLSQAVCEEEEQACGHVAGLALGWEGGGEPMERAAHAREDGIVVAHGALERAPERAQHQRLARPLCF
eukprot:scaffold33330_cov66-Phaeocystis_antarctica.AAC.2